MFIYFIILIALRAVPVNSKKYDVLVPFSNSRYKKGLEVFLLPQLTLPLEYYTRVDIDDSVVSSEDSNENNDDTVLDRDDYSLDNFRDNVDRPIDRNGKPAKLRIVGGSVVDIRLFPHQVEYGTKCGGAIIGIRWILTAAHCGKASFIRSGSKYLDRGLLTKVANHYIHPLWAAAHKEHPFDYDFQVLKLETDLRFDDTTQPIRIANMQDVSAGTMLTVTGWGYTKESGTHSQILQAVQVPIVYMSLCQKVRFPYFQGQLTRRMFCAGYSEGTKDACQGDSGSPAVYNDLLVGLVSFGYGCATPGAYGVYSKVPLVKEWVLETIGKP